MNEYHLIASNDHFARHRQSSVKLSRSSISIDVLHNSGIKVCQLTPSLRILDGSLHIDLKSKQSTMGECWSVLVNRDGMIYINEYGKHVAVVHEPDIAMRYIGKHQQITIYDTISVFEDSDVKTYLHGNMICASLEEACLRDLHTTLSKIAQSTPKVGHQISYLLDELILSSQILVGRAKIIKSISSLHTYTNPVNLKFDLFRLKFTISILINTSSDTLRNIYDRLSSKHSDSKSIIDELNSMSKLWRIHDTIRHMTCDDILSDMHALSHVDSISIYDAMPLKSIYGILCTEAKWSRYSMTRTCEMMINNAIVAKDSANMHESGRLSQSDMIAVRKTLFDLVVNKTIARRFNLETHYRLKLELCYHDTSVDLIQRHIKYLTKTSNGSYWNAQKENQIFYSPHTGSKTTNKIDLKVVAQLDKGHHIQWSSSTNYAATFIISDGRSLYVAKSIIDSKIEVKPISVELCACGKLKVVSALIRSRRAVIVVVCQICSHTQLISFDIRSAVKCKNIPISDSHANKSCYVIAHVSPIVCIMMNSKGVTVYRLDGHRYDTHRVDMIDVNACMNKCDDMIDAKVAWQWCCRLKRMILYVLHVVDGRRLIMDIRSFKLAI